jgi:hypothetical protein
MASFAPVRVLGSGQCSRQHNARLDDLSSKPIVARKAVVEFRSRPGEHLNANTRYLEGTSVFWNPVQHPPSVAPEQNNQIGIAPGGRAPASQRSKQHDCYYVIVPCAKSLRCRPQLLDDTCRVKKCDWRSTR